MITLTGLLSVSDPSFPRASHRRRAFTLIELLLSLVVILLLLGAVVVNFSGAREGMELNEGGARFETLLRLSRAHAAMTGQRVRLEFEDERGDLPSGATARVRVGRELNPLEEPGVFAELTGPEWKLDAIHALVGIEKVEPLGASEERNPGDFEEEPSWSEPSITFQPDGSSDSMRVVLVSRDEADRRRVQVELMGLTGEIRRDVVLEETNDEGQGEELSDLSGEVEVP